MIGGRKERAGASAPLAGARGTVAAALYGLMVAAAALTAPAGAIAAEAALSWQPPTTNTDGSPVTELAGYRVYIGTAPGCYQTSVDAGNHTSHLAYNLDPGNTYYFAVTAYTTSGEESVFSEEVVKSFASAPPVSGSSVQFTVGDALAALRYAVGVAPLGAAQLSQYDVAPLGADGTPVPDGAVQIDDALLILRNSVGLGW